MRNRILILLFLATIFLPTISCADENVYRGPWKGRVIDAETKKPIEGAAVVMVWSKEVVGIGESGSVFLDAKETVTDKDGYFNFPPYKAISIPLIRKITRPPTFTIFKPGYGPFPGWQTTPKEGDLRRVFDKEVAVVELPKLTAYNDRKIALNDAESTIDDIPFKKIMNFLKLIDKENENLGFSIRRLK